MKFKTTNIVSWQICNNIAYVIDETTLITYTFNNTGSYIWNSIVNGKDISLIISELSSIIYNEPNKYIAINDYAKKIILNIHVLLLFFLKTIKTKLH